MTSDHRITADFIHDVLDVLERHGYCRSDSERSDVETQEQAGGRAVFRWHATYR
jgi:hypothetical protein